MSLLTDLIPGGQLLDVGAKIIDRFVPDATAKQAAQDALNAAAQNGEYQAMFGQIEINKIEAASTNWFVAGWRPFIGWMCGVAFAYVAVIEPLARFVATIAGYKGTFPVIDAGVTTQVLLGMLGLATLRTAEKVKNSEGNR